MSRVDTSTIGKKFLMAVTGILMILFLIAHLLGNIPVLYKSGETYNTYANALEDLGVLLNVAETGLTIVALLHIIIAFRLWILARWARPIPYVMARTKMPAEKLGFASRQLIVSGIVLLVFLVIHIWHFKYGPGIQEGYSVQIDGKVVRDFHRLVVTTFHYSPWVIYYFFVMIFLGLHLKHGFWSAFQSLGLTEHRTSRSIYRVGLILSAVLVIGFSIIPISIYFDLTARLSRFYHGS